jgi:hypothetical protein
MVVPALPAGRVARGAPRLVLRGALAALALAALGAVALDCGLVIGAGEYEVGKGPATCGGFAYASTSCGACNAATCCAEATACRKSPACAALFDCYAACAPSDAGCTGGCDRKHPAGADDAAVALAACQTQGCVGACKTCGGIVDWNAEGCAPCVATTCCAGGSACAGDPVCSELQACYRACTYPSCPMNCQSTIAASSGAPLDSDVITEIDTCTSNGCRTQCSYGAHWACVGAFSWPTFDTGDPVALTVHATTFASSGATAFPDALVKVCGRSDGDCTSPLSQASTDADGRLTVTLPAGFNGYLDVTAPDTMESLVYLSWPITMATSTYELQLGPYELYKGLVESDNGTVDDTKGALFVYTRDCLGAPAPGVALTIVPLDVAKYFYFVNGSPVDAQTTTTTDAIGGFANVNAGTVTLTANLGVKGKKLALFTAHVRPATLTYVTLTPTP